MLQNDIYVKTEIKDLPDVRGSYAQDVELAPFTTLKMGGPADVLYCPQDLDDLEAFVRQKPQHIALTLIGNGSNTLIRDGGISGVVCHIDKGCDNVHVKNNILHAECGASCGKVARIARANALEGLAFYGGIPGTIGGALAMNAGAYGKETFDFVESVDVLTDTGEQKTLTPADLPVKYRDGGLPAGWLFLRARFRLQPGDADAIKQEMRRINAERSQSQPLEYPSSGSWFRNPPGDKAWRCVAAAGCRGLRVGDAQVSEKHSNFFINRGQAIASDMERLSLHVQRRVYSVLGIELHREAKIIGLTRKQRGWA